MTDYAAGTAKMLLTNGGIADPAEFPLTVDLILGRWLDETAEEIGRGFENAIYSADFTQLSEA
ncbi:hypothetical protein [Methylobacterium crusticola]|uniref:hypothetical protein n=1 Tax=Methylobacterium crusticola TaxID=1697972 RepID=UPI000FFCA8C2|nr:hypothetical protein [Methylobacterium crusticola]